MYFQYDEEQLEFQTVLGQLLKQHADIEHVRKVTESGHLDRELWAVLCEEMFAPALHIPEEVGGAGFSLVESSILSQELGRTLAPVPFVSTVVALEAVQLAGSDEQQAELIEAYASGAQIVATSYSALSMQASRITADGGTLQGELGFVPFVEDADTILVAVTEAGSPALYLVNAHQSGVTLDTGESLDMTRPGAFVTFTGATGIRLAGAAPDEAVLERIDAVGKTLLAHEMVGAAREALALAVDYAKIRKQFNREIGSFQAVKHLLSEASIGIELAHPVSDFASIEYGNDDFVHHARLAKFEAATAYLTAASNSIQVHGGMGFTWEALPQLYYRRAQALSQAYGNANEDLLGVYRSAEEQYQH